MDSGHYLEILQQEIALEGLDGITLPMLWVRLQARKDCSWPSHISDKQLNVLWQCVAGMREVDFYLLLKPRPDFVVIDRFAYMDFLSEICNHPEDLGPDVCEFKVVQNGNILGSCSTFETRVNITKEICDEDLHSVVSYLDVMEKWERRLVVVASQEQRNLVLCGQITLPNALIGRHVLRFCVLEAVGRARWNGLVTASIVNYCSFQSIDINTKLRFLIIKSLIYEGLVSKKRFVVKKSGHCYTSVIIHLSSFATSIMDQIRDVQVKVFRYLLGEQGHRKECKVIKDRFNLNDKSRFEAFMLHMPAWLKVRQMMYSELCHGEDASDQNTDGKRKVSVMEIDLNGGTIESREMTVKQEPPVDDDNDGEKQEENDEEMIDDENDLLWKPATDCTYRWLSSQGYLSQIYHYIGSCGPRGISEKDLHAAMGLRRHGSRLAINLLKAAELVKSMIVSVDKTRAEILTAKCFKQPTLDKFLKAMYEFRQKTTAFDHSDVKLSVSNNRTLSVSDIVSPGDETVRSSKLVASTVAVDRLFASMTELTCTLLDSSMDKTYLSNSGLITSENVSDRIVNIANIFLDVVKEHRLILSLGHCRRLIEERQREMGQKIDSTMCHRTIRRMAQWCRDEGKLNIYNFRFNYKESHLTMSIMAAIDVTKDDLLILSAVRKFKFINFGYIIKKQLDFPFFQKMLSWYSYQKAAIRQAMLVHPEVVKIPKQSKDGVRKMVKAMRLHQLLCYLLYDYKGSTDISPTTPCFTSATDLKNGMASQASDSQKVIDDSDSILRRTPVYLDVNDFRRFLQPIPTYKGDTFELLKQSTGVCSIGDMFLSMPISIFACVTSYEHYPGIAEYMMDWEKCLLPVTSLPLSLLGLLLRSRYYLQSFLAVLINLCQMGLISFGPMQYIEKSKQFIYVRKTGLLLDTRPSERGNAFTALAPDMDEFLEMQYNFNSLSDVERYWNDMRNIATHTNLQIYSSSDRPCAKSQARVQVPMEKQVLQSSFEHVVKDYCLPGDRRGAAGFDSSFFVHLVRNWENISRLHRLKHKAARMSKSSAKGSDDSKNSNSICGDRNSAVKETSSSTVTKEPGSINIEQFRTLTGLPEDRMLGENTKTLLVSYLSKYRTRGRKTRSYGNQETNGKTRSALDEKDRVALVNKPGKRCFYTKEENAVILAGKVAINFLTGQLVRRQFLPPLRDVLHERISYSRHKTCAVLWTHVLRECRRPNVRKVQNCIFHKLSVHKTLMNKYSSLVIQPSEPHNVADVCQHIKDLTNDILDTFVMCGSETGLPHNTEPHSQSVNSMESRLVPNRPWKPVTTPNEICYSVLHDFQLSYIMSMWDKQGRNYELFSTLGQYPESIVSRAFRDLQTNNVITRKKRLGEIVTGELSRYRLHSLCQKRLRDVSDADSLFLSSYELEKTLSSKIVHNFTDCSSTTGHLAYMIGRLATNQMKVTMDISTNVLDLSKVSLTDMDKQRCSQQKRSHEQVMVEGEDDVSLQDFTVKKMKECNADGVGVTSPGAKKPCLGNDGPLHGKSSECNSQDDSDICSDVFSSSARKRHVNFISSSGKCSGKSPVSKRCRPDLSTKRGIYRDALVKAKMEVIDGHDEFCDLLASTQISQKQLATGVKLDEELDACCDGNAWTFGAGSMTLTMSPECDGPVGIDDGKGKKLSSRVSHTSIALRRWQLHHSLSADTERLPFSHIPLCLYPISVAILPSRQCNIPEDVSHVKPAHRAGNGQLGSVSGIQKSPPLYTISDPPSCGFACMDSSDNQQLWQQWWDLGTIQVFTDDHVDISEPFNSQLNNRPLHQRIMSGLTEQLLFSIDMGDVWKCAAALFDRGTVPTFQLVYGQIDMTGITGATWNVLLESTAISPSLLLSSLEFLTKQNAVVRVGVVVHCYVSLPNARHWLVHTLKNTRGRGSRVIEDDIPLSDLFTEESLASTSTTDFSDAKQNTGRQNNVSDTQFNDESKVPLTVTVKDKSADLCKSCNQHNIHAMSVKRLPCNGSITNQLEVGDFSPDSCRKCSIATSDGTLLPINSAQNAQYTFAQAGDEKCVKQLSMCSRNNTDTTTSTTSVSDQRDSNADAENSDDPRRSGRDVERSRKKMKRSDKANTFSIPSSTYESVRLLSRVWRRPEGGVNRSFLKNLLDTVTFHAMSRPGITAERLAESFGHLLSPVHVRELLEILDSLGCVKLLRVSQKKKISLFSTPPTTAHIEVADGVDTIGASMQELVVEPAVDCTHRLGAFLSYLH